MARKERCEVRSNPDGPYSRAPTAMWDGERLVQVEVRNIRTEGARLRQAHQRVQVGTVDIHLAAGGYKGSPIS